MKRALGYGASTCSYRDWIGTDLIVLFGSNTPSNQPVTMKYLYYARKAGTKVAVVNPYFEPGLQRYWVPSVTESVLFGTKFADEWFAVDTGGDLPFLNGVFKVLVAEGWVDHDFISRHTAGFEEAKATLERQDWDLLERESGATRPEMRRFAEMLRDARNGIFVWSMGLTQHAHGVETIEALINVGLARGWVGREKAGPLLRDSAHTVGRSATHWSGASRVSDATAALGVEQIARHRRRSGVQVSRAHRRNDP